MLTWKAPIYAHLLDQDPSPGRFILTGSQQFEVMSNLSQSLAGRTGLLKLLPLSIEEMSAASLPTHTDSLLLSGFYPRIYDRGLDPTQALGDYVATYVERDIHQLITIQNLSLFGKFLRLCAGRTGQLLNLQSLGNDVGISHTTARSWLTLLEAGYIVFLLQPWHTSISKRQIKSPKLYFYDPGLASYLLGAKTEQHIKSHPLRGNLFENLIILETLKYRFNRGRGNNLFFWRDNTGNEVDLLIEHGPDISAVEIKAGATINRDYFKGLRTFSRRLGRPPHSSHLVYDGSERQQRSDPMVWRAADTAEMMAAAG